jgi:Tfp pilus assembly protein PilF
MNLIENLESLLAKGQDTALLRFSLGKAYLHAGQYDTAVGQLAKAVTLDPRYSAAWKVYGQALTRSGRVEEAMAAYKEGVKIAEARGDIQAAKEMKVFLRRLTRLAVATKAEEGGCGSKP